MTNKNKLEFIHHDDVGENAVEWYEVIHEGSQVLTIRRQSDLPYRWVAHDNEGKQCFEPNQYRNDLFEEIKYEGVFE